MITVGMNYEVIEGKQEAFESMFRKVLQVMGKMEGHGESHLFVNVDRRASYVVLSQWTSDEAFNAFIKSDQFKQVTTWGKEKVLSGRPTHEVFGRAEKVC